MVSGNFDGCKGLLCTREFSPTRRTTWNEIKLKNLKRNHNLSTHYRIFNRTREHEGMDGQPPIGFLEANVKYEHSGSL